MLLSFRHFLLFAGLLGCSVSSVWAQAGGAASPFKTDKEKISYGIGLNVGRGMLQDGLLLSDLELELLLAGLRDSLSEKPLSLNQKEFDEAFRAFIVPKLEERAKVRAEKIKADGVAFLAKNKTNPEFKTTASGLQYKIIKSGKGKTPKLTDTVRALYKGTLIDGTLFDQSPEPVPFPVSRVIKGWTEALQLMREGDKWQLVIPANLAYGENGSPPEIPPHSVLIFDVELVSVEAPPPAGK